MRFMIIVKATKDSEAGVMPTQKDFAKMAEWHEEAAKAGILLDGSGLRNSAQGWRVKYAGGKSTLVDGPFAETKELVAGFWIWKVRSMAEAIEWAKRCPNPMPGDSDLEIRPVFEADDFGAEFTPELREQEERLRARIEKQQGS